MTPRPREVTIARAMARSVLTRSALTRSVLAGLLLLGTAGCSGADGAVPQQAASPTVTPLPFDTASPTVATGALQLYVSNQSFKDGTVAIRVTVDGATVVDQDFEVGNQHNWISFPLVLPAGARTVEATTDSGATLTASVTVPAGGTHYAVIDYWSGDGEPTRLIWNESGQPIGFA